MINKIIYETADYVNFKYPGLIFTTELIFQENLNSITVSVKNLGKNPRQNLKNIFNSEAETLKSQANINKKSCSSILNLAKDLIEMSRLEVTMLSTNNKILKKERKFSKDLNSLTLDIKLLMEGMRSNYSIESKKLLDKILQKELLEINQKLKRLQSNYTELKECEIDSFFNVSEFIKSNRLEKYLDAFNYENSYQTLINFFEMSSINLNHAVLETQKLIGSTIDSDETVPLFFDVQNIILESQKFFLKNENNLIACIIFVYDKLAAAIQKYIEVLEKKIIIFFLLIIAN